MCSNTGDGRNGIINPTVKQSTQWGQHEVWLKWRGGGANLQSSCEYWRMSWNIGRGSKTCLGLIIWIRHGSSISTDTEHYISWLKPMLSFHHSAQELYRISKENCDFKVTAGPSTSNDDKGSSGGDSGGSSPSSSSNKGALPKKTSKFTSHVHKGKLHCCCVSGFT